MLLLAPNGRSAAIRYKKQTLNTIITQAYHSRCSFWKLSSQARIASDFSTLLRIKQGENENDAIPNRIFDFDKWRISQPKTQ